MQAVCDQCGWRYLVHRRQVHLAIHGLLPKWPCVIRDDFGHDLEPEQFPLALSAILVHGLYQLHSNRPVISFSLLDD